MLACQCVYVSECVHTCMLSTNALYLCVSVDASMRVSMDVCVCNCMSVSVCVSM